MSQPKLFLLDAMALIYRAHFAFSKTPRITSTGLNTGAVFGFANTLLEILQKEKPTHLGIAFESRTPTFRHQEFTAYKAQRDAQPEDISIALPYVARLAEAMRIPVLFHDGYEADDVVGTLARQAAEAGFEVYMMTPDKDYAQLVQPGVYLYKPSYMGKGVDVWGVPEVLNRWQIARPLQVTDILGLQGDASDNIPGVPGVGEKTAIKLIQEWDSVENLIENADQLKGKLRERIVEHAEQARLSKHLATIVTDVPVTFDADALLCRPPDEPLLSALLQELEFRTLARRMLGEQSPAAERKKPAAQTELFAAASADAEVPTAAAPSDVPPATGRLDTIATVAHRYHLMDTPAQRAALVAALHELDTFCFDTETDRTDALHAELVGMAFAWHPGEAYYVPVPTDQAEARALVAEFAGVFENPATTKVGQNLKFDITVLDNYGVRVAGPLFDTMLAHYLLEPGLRHGLDYLAETYLHYQPVPIASLIGKRGKDQQTMRSVPVAEVAEYAGEDADLTWQLAEVLRPQLAPRGLDKLLTDVEGPLVRVLTDMERAGVRIDPDALGELSALLTTESAQVEQRIYETAGQTFNIGSPKQLGEVLFDQMKLVDKPRKTPTGQYKTGEDVLAGLAEQHPIAADILLYRQLQKLKSTYVDALPTLISPADGRVHTSFNQAVTATGRLSSTGPNLQNIPIRTERGREIRKAFVPRDADHVIMAADYSQIELRIMADFSDDTGMIEAFAQGQDVHASTASKVFGVPLAEVTSAQRRQAKTINFGIIYGVSAHGLGQRLGISRDEAGDIIAAYFREFAGVKAYMDRVIEEARTRGYVTTVLGRRRYLPDIGSRNQNLRGFAERNAINAPIQGSAADMIKVAMIRIADWLRREQLRTRMILQVHDELVFDVPRAEVDDVRAAVVPFMREAIAFRVPMEVEVGVGDNWLEAH